MAVFPGGLDWWRASTPVLSGLLDFHLPRAVQQLTPYDATPLEHTLCRRSDDSLPDLVLIFQAPMIAFVSRYSSMPWTPYSRPLPERL
jgi:hypothetical protein